MLWRPHVSNLTTKLSKFAPIIARMTKLCNLDSLKMIYYALIYSNIIYCNSVWSGSCQRTLKPLIVKHKLIVRSIAGVPRLSHTEPLFLNLSLLPLSLISQYMVAIFVYRCLNDEDFSNWFPPKIHVRTTRQSERNLLSIPFSYSRQF